MDLAMLASGALDGFCEFGLQPWDCAAGIVLIEEAGGRVSDVLGGPLELDRPRVLASNGHLHDTMIQVLAGLDEELPLPR
jgi:myo-inositol-1(or 4)-monophosphatase